MRKFSSVVVAWVFCLPLSAATYNITSSHITDKGWFKAPNTGVFNFGLKDIAFVPDCMSTQLAAECTATDTPHPCCTGPGTGCSDPSPSDGYPGCLLAVDSDNGPDNHQTMGMLDIVPPTATGENTATMMVDSFDFVGTVPDNATPPRPPDGKNKIAIYYEQGPPCYIRWVFMLHYANGPDDADEFFGFSDCSTTTPNPQGMWRFDETTDLDTTLMDPWNVSSWVHKLTRIPQGMADDYFSGNAMMMGPGKSVGSRGSSAGPSFGVRPWTWPTDGSDYDQFVPVVYYKECSQGLYPEWYQCTDFQWPDGETVTKSDNYQGGLPIRIVSGGDNYETILFYGRRPRADQRLYPWSEIATARPDEDSTKDEDGIDPPGGQWPLYSSTNGGLWPDVTSVPQVDYGIPEYPGYPNTNNIVQLPAYVDYEDESAGTCSDGGVRCRLPFDTRLTSTCQHGTGPSLASATTYLILYNAAELGRMYQGTSVYEPYEVQPYEFIDVFFDPDNDGDEIPETCVQADRFWDIDYDHTNNLLYAAHSSSPSGSAAPYNAAGQMAIRVFAFDVGEVTPPIAPAESKLDGAKLSGASIGE